MENINKKISLITRNLNLGELNETKKLALLEKIGDVFTYRILLKLIAKTDESKRTVFIEKINENKNNPDKILLFIDHFVENADSLIDTEISHYQKDLEKMMLKKN